MRIFCCLASRLSRFIYIAVLESSIMLKSCEVKVENSRKQVLWDGHMSFAGVGPKGEPLTTRSTWFP